MSGKVRARLRATRICAALGRQLRRAQDGFPARASCDRDRLGLNTAGWVHYSRCRLTRPCLGQSAASRYITATAGRRPPRTDVRGAARSRATASASGEAKLKRMRAGPTESPPWFAAASPDCRRGGGEGPKRGRCLRVASHRSAERTGFEPAIEISPHTRLSPPARCHLPRSVSLTRQVGRLRLRPSGFDSETSALTLRPFEDPELR